MQNVVRILHELTFIIETKIRNIELNLLTLPEKKYAKLIIEDKEVGGRFFITKPQMYAMPNTRSYINQEFAAKNNPGFKWI